MLRSEYYGDMPQLQQQFHNVISGSVTTVPIEGQSSSAIQVLFEPPNHTKSGVFPLITRLKEKTPMIRLIQFSIGAKHVSVRISDTSLGHFT